MMSQTQVHLPLPVITPPPDDPSVHPPVDLSFVDQAVARIGTAPDALIPILQALQHHYHYLPAPALKRLCEISQITPAAISGVSTFYSQFRHEPAGKHIVRVCHGTACHVKNAQLVEDAVRRHLHLDADHHTDAKGEFTIERVGCLGCCTLAPVMQIDSATYGHMASDTAPRALIDFLNNPHTNGSRGSPLLQHAPDPNLPEIHIGVGSCCIAGGSMAVRNILEQSIADMGLRIPVKPVGCVGMCHQTPLVDVVYPGRPPIFYSKVKPEEAHAIIRRHFKPRGLLRKIQYASTAILDRLISDDHNAAIKRQPLNIRDKPVEDFLGHQKRIASEYCGDLNPLDIDEYIAHEGFIALKKALEIACGTATPGDGSLLIEQIKASGLRGRGGAGFPTGLKWQRTRAAPGDTKYLICNGDEGDPGAFMDRMILESYPYRVLEGMIIAALAVGATHGIFYIRHEYPLAVERIRKAIDICREKGILGKSVLGSSFGIDFRVMEGAGAFVCGEETALIASIEGRRGMPRLRPPFPSDSGLWNKPTCVNNVETYALVPWIIRHGPPAFAALGTALSKGTKVFALTGKIQRGGLIEVPMGVSIRQIVEEIGGGVTPGRTFKAVQIGGPSGGCIPAELADTPVDYESLRDIGAIMGSGGLVVLDDRDCMVDMARFFLQFTQAESCGKCTFCRIGTLRMLEILTRLCNGSASRDDLARLEELCDQVTRASLCGLGQTAPNPVLTTLKYFRHEYEAHLDKRCPAGQCKALIKYHVTDDCIGCTRCSQQCPVNAIPLKPYEKHAIDTEKCTRCDICRRICPVNSIVVTSPC